MIMDKIVYIAAGLLIGMAFLAVFFNPFFIGKEREPYRAWNYLFEMFWSACVVIVSGRVFGWW